MSLWRNETIHALAKLGFSVYETRQFIRASATLHTWAEHECNGAIQRDEETGRPSWYNTNTGKRICGTSDRESGALKRAKAIAAERGFEIYHEGYPRGCALYLYRQTNLDEFSKRAGEPFNIDCCYNSLGTAVVP